MSRRQPSKKGSRTASSGTVLKVLDQVRAQLQEAGAMAGETAALIHESYDFEPDRPDLGCLCDLVAELLDSVAAKLVVTSVLRGRSPELWGAIEEQRRRLRRVEAVLCSMTYFLRRTPGSKAPHLLVVYSLAADCKSALTTLDPAALNLRRHAP